MSAVNIYMEQTTLTVSDLIGLRDIINIATKRGSFDAKELSTVGSIYDKLNNFIETAQQQLQNQEPPAQTQGDEHA